MRIALSLIAGSALLSLMGACAPTSGIGPDGQPRLMARATDTALNNVGPLQDGKAAIVIDPDGCQGWLIDDGAEGYSGRRFDNKSGLPVCGGAPPGSVINDPQTTGFVDILP